MYEGLAKEFSNATFIYLVRDGRDVVRSLMNRRHYRDKDHHSYKYKPTKNDIYRKAWKRMDRFEKVCWYWMHGNQYILTKSGLTPVKFENLITNYTYFKNNILEKTGISVPESKWRAEVKSPSNKTKKYGFPKWTEWNNVMIRKFNAICGPTMKSLGYN